MEELELLCPQDAVQIENIIKCKKKKKKFRLIHK